MAFSSHFVGVPQSRWAGYAILAAIIAVALAILFGKERIPLGQRLLVIFIMFLLALPTIGLVLFQINCLVAGTSKAPFCGWYAWIVSALTILYCVLLIVVAVTIKSSEEHAKQAEEFAVASLPSFEQANSIAAGLMSAEGFEDGAAPEDTAGGAPEVADADIPMPPSADALAAEPETFLNFRRNQNTARAAAKRRDRRERFTDVAEAEVEEPEEEKKEGFVDYSFGAAPVAEAANMYML